MASENNARFETPPRARPLPPCSPSRGAEFAVNLKAALTGEDLGQLKVTSTTELRDVHQALLAAIGGMGVSVSVMLMVGGKTFENPVDRPFLEANHGSEVLLFKQLTSDMYYADVTRRTPCSDVDELF